MAKTTMFERSRTRVRFSNEEERIWALILPRLTGEPYRPPRVRDIAKAMNIDSSHSSGASTSPRRWSSVFTTP